MSFKEDVGNGGTATAGMGEDSIYSHYLGIIYRPVIKQEQEAAKPEASQKLYIQDRIFTEENLIRLAQAEKRYVYGAGKFARKYINYLRQIGVGFNGVIVTDRKIIRMSWKELLSMDWMN